MMLDWIHDYRQMLTLLINIGMLLVWIVYLQLFLSSYKRQTRPKILINVGAGRNLDGRCLISNMSPEAISIESLIATVETSERQWVCPVTDAQELAEKQDQNLRSMTVQGPLTHGEMMDVGSFRDLIHHAVRDSDCPIESEGEIPETITAFEIQAIADFGPDDLLVGAKRRFELARKDGAWTLGQHSPQTEQIRSRSERRRIKRLLGDVDP